MTCNESTELTFSSAVCGFHIYRPEWVPWIKHVCISFELSFSYFHSDGNFTANLSVWDSLSLDPIIFVCLDD